MRIRKANAEAVQTARLNRQPNLAQMCYPYMGEQVQQRKSLTAITQQYQGKFRDDEGMDRDLPLVQVLAQLFVFRTEVVDPNRRVRENHFSPACGVEYALVSAWCLPAQPVGGRFPARSGL